MEETLFEILDAGDYLRLEPIELIKYESEIDWDKNWIKTKISIKSGNFSGQYFADFMTVDFEKLKKDFNRIYDNLKGFIDFSDLEGYLELKISGDGIGHFLVRVNASDNPSEINNLTFELNFDQTQIKGFISQLERITKLYPIVGDLKIQ